MIEVAVLVRIDFASALVARVELAGPDAWCCTAIRLGQNHMHRSSSSALRRTLAGLPLDEQGSAPDGRAASCGSTRTSFRLASWMTDKLKASRVEHPQPRTVEAAIV
ncbi:hypothetical protein [Pseudonocardia sp. T1-2H]|uniref:hypothetical protein n=1 Tax=Pseudonocardia sp. T1-2H TaxID=3128899 RepID=UPI003100E44F